MLLFLPTPTLPSHRNHSTANTKRQRTVCAAGWPADAARVARGVAGLAAGLALGAACLSGAAAEGGSDAATSKVTAGAASTLNSGSEKNITRGVDLSGANFAQRKLRGVSFQQSILREADFRGSDLTGASFFDADLANANFEGAVMRNANLELANMRGANLTGAIVEGSYVVGATKFDGIKIENSDWTEVGLRKDQQRYLCSRASGVNPVTEVDTKESLLCPQ